MHALAQPVSSIAATSTADQITQAKEMDTPVKFRGGKRLESKSIKIRGGKRLGSKSMGRWRRYSDATTIKDALQAGGTPSDMRNDFEKGLMAIENFQTPEPVRGYAIHGHFDTVNCSASVRLHMLAHSSGASHAVTKTVAYPTPTHRRNDEDALQAGGTSSH